MLGSHLGARERCAGAPGSHFGVRKHRTGALGSQPASQPANSQPAAWNLCLDQSLGFSLGARKHCTCRARESLRRSKTLHRPAPEPLGRLNTLQKRAEVHLGARKHCTRYADRESVRVTFQENCRGFDDTLHHATLVHLSPRMDIPRFTVVYI